MLTRTPIRPFSRNLLVLDVETTGSDPLVHEVVDLGAVLLDGATLNPLKTFESLMRPDSLENADPKAMRIHGLAIVQLASAPSPAEALLAFTDTMGQDFTICGWNVCFDAQFLARLFRHAGRFDVFQQIDYHKFDLWSLLQSLWVHGTLSIEPKSFSDVCAYFGLDRQTDHRALEDAVLAAEVLRRAFQFLDR